MITGVTGVLEARGSDWLKVRIGGGVSLQVFVPSSTIEDLGSLGEEVRLHTRLYIKDDEAVLYGFSTPEALRLFQMLNGVTGIGPRTSLSLLSSLTPDSLIAAVATGDIDTLSRAPGIGRKGASRLVLELKGKLEKELAEMPTPAAQGDGEVISALMALGYSAAESRRAAAAIGRDGGLPLEERIRGALQQLAG